MSSRFVSFFYKWPVPRAGTVVRSLYYPLFRLSLHIRCRWADLQDPSSAADGCPLPPAMLRFRVSEDLSVGEFVRIGQGCARIIAERFEAVGMELSSANRVLDFGCGCGRVVRWLMHDHPNIDFHGVDVDREAIEWCSENLSGGVFSVNAPTPPLSYPDRHFDTVYCLSVFTHLDEPMQDAWLEELGRVLRPGGVLLFTVHGENARVGLDTSDVETLLSQGFLHKCSKKLSGIVPEWYQTTWHSREYIYNRLAGGFQDLYYSTAPDHLQDFVVARRRP